MLYHGRVTLKKTAIRCCLCLFLVLSSTIHSLAEDTWSGFQNGGRPPNEGPPLTPLEWDGTAGIAWSATIEGYGQSSPVADGRYIYLTSVSGDNMQHCHVLAVDRNDGSKVWHHQFANPSPEENTNYVSRAAPSPVVDDERVIAWFEGGLVVAFSLKGDRLWKRNLVADYGAIKVRHGLAASIEQNDHHAFIWVERQDDPYVLALSKKTGETLWKSQGVGATSWSSPRLVPVEENNHLVLSAIGKIVGVNPSDGQILWEFDDISGNSTPTPIPVGNGRFLIGATTGRGGASDDGNSAASNGLIQIHRDDQTGFSASYVWRAKRATSSFGSPLAFQGHAYFVNRRGVVYCLDLETGEERYAQRIASSIWATPIGVADRIYFFGKDGTTSVLKTGSGFQLLANNSLNSDQDVLNSEPNVRSNGRVLYAALLVGPDLILRRGSTLFKISPSS